MDDGCCGPSAVCGAVARSVPAAVATVGGAKAMANYIGHNGYPQPEIVAIATGKPSAAAAAAVCSSGPAAADCFDIEFGGVLQEQPSSRVSVVDLTNLDTIAEADDSVEM